MREKIESFVNYNVLVIGDVMIDSYMWGKVDRISPEAPVPVVSSNKIENRLGGAANVALNVQALGAVPILCSVIGNDDKGSIFYELLKKRNLSTQGIVVDNKRVTTVKTRIICDNQHLLRIDEEEDSNLHEHLEREFIEHIEKIINTTSINAIIFEDYDKGVITPLVIERIVDLANQKGIPTLVDPKKRNFAFYKNVTLFKPNFKELVEGLKLDFHDKTDYESIYSATKRLHEDYNMKFVLITLSEKGVFISDNENYATIPAEVRDIADVSGAGDTVISTASLCLASGMPVGEIARISNLAGGLVCEKVGVVPIDKALLIKELQ